MKTQYTTIRLILDPFLFIKTERFSPLTPKILFWWSSTMKWSPSLGEKEGDAFGFGTRKERGKIKEYWTFLSFLSVLIC